MHPGRSSAPSVHLVRTNQATAHTSRNVTLPTARGFNSGGNGTREPPRAVISGVPKNPPPFSPPLSLVSALVVSFDAQFIALVFKSDATGVARRHRSRCAAVLPRYGGCRDSAPWLGFLARGEQFSLLHLPSRRVPLFRLVLHRLSRSRRAAEARRSGSSPVDSSIQSL